MRPWVAAMLIGADGEIPVEPNAGVAETEAAGAGGAEGVAGVGLEVGGALVGGAWGASVVGACADVDVGACADADARVGGAGDPAIVLAAGREPATDCGADAGADVQAASRPSRPPAAVRRAHLRR